MIVITNFDDLIFYLEPSDKVYDCYLAVPYSHDDKSIEEERFEKVTELASDLTRCGLCVISPITHSHPQTKYNRLPGTWDFWGAIDSRIMPVCQYLIVYQLDGWEESVGIKNEMELFKRINFAENIVYYKPE